MLRQKLEKSHWLVFGIIALALIAIGAGVSVFAFREARNSIYHEKFSALNMAGKVGALTIDPADHAKLKNPRDSFSSAYGNLQQSVASLVSSTEYVDRAYTVVKQDNNYYSVLNAEAYKSDSRDSQLYHPLVSPPRELLDSFTERAHHYNSQPYGDRWGSWYGSFWPILDESGEVQFVLAVESNSKQFELPLEKLKNAFIAAVSIVFLLSFGIAWIATTLIVPRSAQKRTRHLRFIRPISEFLLVLFLVVLVGDGLTSLRTRSELDLKHSSLAKNLERLDQVEELSNKLNNGFRPNTDGMDILINSTNSAGWTDISSTLESLKFGTLTPESTASELKNRISNIESQLTADINSTSLEMQHQTQSILRTMVLAFFMAVGSLILVRHSSKQERQISDALDNSTQLQTRYQNVVGNLPIGLFTYINGEWSFANQEWLRQINAEPGAERTESFFNAIHPDDREETRAIFDQAERERNPFRLEYRLLLNDGNIRHMESRGIPVYAADGSFEQMLGFNVDVTRIVQARIAQQQAFGEIENKNKLLSSALGELEQALESIVLSFIKAVEAKDPYTAGHSERVMQYSLWLGEAIGLGPYELRILELGTLVHDVGKIGIPDAILTKPDRLTDEEFAVIQKHPEYGEEILKSIGIFRECLPIVRSHHERLNGMGYPDGLQGDQIPMLVRISTIADMFDAMTSNRAYRAGMPIEKVLSIMRECVDKGELDAQLFAVFCQVVKERGIIEQRDKKNPSEAA
ncbi:MAG: HD domain-containing protein [Armatimonadetes bacterium]|nr:HD domain-containing protein [Armatimonadota bacterium]